MFSLPILITRGLDLHYAGNQPCSYPLFSFQGVILNSVVGVFNGEGPPVPIPNTEVKLTSAENTCLATDWEDRSMPTLMEPLSLTLVPFFLLRKFEAAWFYNFLPIII